MMCTTPASASPPYTAEAGPRSTSMRSTWLTSIADRSNALPRVVVGSLSLTPSSRISRWLFSAPRMYSDTKLPDCPAWST